MSHIITWLTIALGLIIAHAIGAASQDAAGLCMVVAGVALAAHKLFVWGYSLGEVEEMPFPDLHDEFVRRYFVAAQTGKAADWLQAALAAKRWENALSKPRKHTTIPAFLRRST